MSSIVNNSKDTLYKISTPNFEGPLDLLLQLIERAALDITQLSLAHVTDQFLNHIKYIKNISANEISSFVVIASKLIQIKSLALLPKTTLQLEQDEDVGESLVRQLIEYKKFKTVSTHLSERETMGLKTFLRISAPFRVEQSLDLSNISIKNLAEAAYIVLSQQNSNNLISQTISPPRISIRQKVDLIIKKLTHHSELGFWSLFSKNKEKLDVVITFLALLELIKQNLVSVYQNALFEEITISKNELLHIENEIDLEFD